jgi:hypothetical protein
MLVMEFFRWWYGPGWRQFGANLSQKLHAVAGEFSIVTLIRTLFNPWRRITSLPGPSLQDHARAWVDNLVSRAVGAAVRTLTLMAASLLLMLYVVGGGLVLVMWPIVPILALGLVIAGFMWKQAG